MRQRLSNGAHDTEKVLVQRLLPGRFVVGVEGPGRWSARIVHDDVEPAEGIDCRGDEALDVVQLRHIAGHRDDFRVGRRLDFLSRRIELFAAPGADRNAAAFPRQSERHRAADTATSASDQRHLVSQS